MSEQIYDAALLLDDELSPKISIAEAEALKQIQIKFINSYFLHKDSMPLEEWLQSEIAESLPEYNKDEVEQISNDIMTSLHVQEEKKASLEKAIQNGRSKESWFAGEIKNATSYMSAQEASEYLQNLDSALTASNESLYRTIHTQAGVVSQNPNLDGFIAEQYHAQTFNLNAEASGSPYRAKVLEPNGKGYAKNSVDIVIVDGDNKVVKRYQSKYCKDSSSTAQAFERGDYRGQQKLVPKGQEETIPKKATPILEAPDGTCSTPLSKAEAKDLQKEAQSGNWNDLNWNEYQTKDLAIGIGKNAGQAALMGAAAGIGFDVAQKVWNGEEIDGSEVIETAITTGADIGVKAAAAGALKVGVEKGIITAIPKGTPAGTIANIVHVAAENVKVVGKMATGELTVKEGMEKMEQVTISTTAGIVTSVKGSAIGAAVGTVFGPAGTFLGGVVGGGIGYLAGSKVGETVVKGVQKIREKAKDVVKSVSNSFSKTVNKVSNGVHNICSGLKSLFSW